MEPVDEDTSKVLLADANVLIDYRDAELEILALVAQHLAPLVIVSQVLEEVRGLSAETCEQLGINLIEPETEMLLEAASGSRRVSFNDQLCFPVCRKEDWTCVTNDRALRKLCQSNGVDSRYGLRLMIDLAQVGALPTQRAIAIAQTIHDKNPLHINTDILSRFSDAISQL